MKRHYSFSASVILTIPFWNPSNALLEQGFNLSREDWFFNGILGPEAAAQLPAACVTAYTRPIDCNVTILMSPKVGGKKATLEDACKQECAASLLEYEGGAREACNRRGGTEKICDISQSDYELAWEMATSEAADSVAISEFCNDSCLTQTVVLNVPTEGNLNDMKKMCGTNIGKFPFIDAMLFAGLIKRDNDGSMIAANATAKASSRGSRGFHYQLGWVNLPNAPTPPEVNVNQTTDKTSAGTGIITLPHSNSISALPVATMPPQPCSRIPSDRDSKSRKCRPLDKNNTVVFLVEKQATLIERTGDEFSKDTPNVFIHTVLEQMVITSITEIHPN
ncbi:hypothetical protein C7212DRAFT_344178 [Tuber magnatum]|uniref:Uncharacterized protein n=1 Tax=Tuber magnatum TaxID=42249 RepID=A0A317SSJ0_9PEZI|nr:hypothetical protein C7212DRAFT_344178 [Tuber magnatum]